MIPLLRFLRFYSNKSTNEVRQAFIDHFCAHNQHKFIKSSSVIPRKGSGTYFTNAGMNQFKQIILGELNSKDIIDESKYVGIANSQKCIRIGGKHSDLDTIGKDDYHHTFFEMLGNWSFGANGKEQACKLALELLVDVYKLNPNKLYFTYFNGSKEYNLDADLETHRIWLSLGIPADRILGFGMRENFWEMDAVGPCGPCTEIHYDRTNMSSHHLVNSGDEKCIELWNLVFMQYNRLSPHEFTQLPQMVIDTGMGLERLVAVLNGKTSNYANDNFQVIFDQIYSFVGQSMPHFNQTTSQELRYAYRTISDHMRSIVVSIGDGLMPSKTGLGGYLKYLMLKCFNITRHTFKIDKNPYLLLNTLVPVIVDTLKNAYPELESDVSRIQHVIRTTDDTRQFKLKKYEEITNRYLNKLKNSNELNGKQLWLLHKGDGSGEHVPIDFIEDYCKEKSIRVDKQGFDVIYLEETENSLKNVKNTRSENTQLMKICTTLKHKAIKNTNDHHKYTYVLDTTQKRSIASQLNTRIVALMRIDDKNNLELVEKLLPNEKCVLVLEDTNFFAEEGGQESDVGVISNLSTNEHQISISNVKKLQGYVFHYGQVDSGEWSVSKQVSLKYNELKRFKTTLNHTSIHLLNHVLRDVYSNETSIIQVNSLAKPNYFKFEFLYNGDFKKEVISQEIIQKIQTKLQELIDKQLKINDSQVDRDQVDELKCVRKLRDVLYPFKVRIVSIGEKGATDFSAEFCCGTHATNTKQLEAIILKNFSSTVDGHFEIEACSSSDALKISNNDKHVDQIYRQMIELDPNDFHDLNKLSIKSSEIENFIKQNPLSLTFRLKLQKELDKLRPSKYKIQRETRKYLMEKVKLTNNLEIESVLDTLSLSNIINKLETNHTMVQILNTHRRTCFIYSMDKKECDEAIDLMNKKYEIQLKYETFDKTIAIRLPID